LADKPTVLLGRPVQDDLGLGYPLPGLVPVVEHLAGVLEGPALRQFSHHLGQETAVALVADAPVVIGADQEPSPLAIPAAVVLDRVGLAVNDEDGGLVQSLLVNEAHDR